MIGFKTAKMIYVGDVIVNTDNMSPWGDSPKIVVGIIDHGSQASGPYSGSFPRYSYEVVSYNRASGGKAATTERTVRSKSYRALLVPPGETPRQILALYLAKREQIFLDNPRWKATDARREAFREEKEGKEL